MLDQRDHPRGAQCVEFGTAFDRGLGHVFVQADHDRHAGGVGGRLRGGRRIRVARVRHGRLLGLDAALGTQAGAVVDQRLDIDVAVGLDVCGAANGGQHAVIALRKRQCASHLEGGRAGTRALRRCGKAARERAEDAFEHRLAVQERDAVVKTRVVGLDAGGGRHGVLHLQLGDDARAAAVGRHQHMQRLELEACGGVRYCAQVDRDAGPGLGVGLGELDHLRLHEAVVALQVEFVQAADDVVGAAIDQAQDRRRSLGVLDRLAELEGQAQQLEVDPTAAARGVVELDRVGRGAVGAALVLPGHRAAGEGLLVHQLRPHDRSREFDRHAVDRLLLGQGELDEVGLVEGRERIVHHVDDDVGLVVDEAADAGAAAHVVADAVFGHQAVRADVDGVGVGVKRIVEVHVARLRRVGHCRVDRNLELGGLADHRLDMAVDTGLHIRVRELERKRQAGRAVRIGAGFRLGLGLDLADGDDIGRVALDQGTLLDRGLGGDGCIAHRQRCREARARGVLLGLGLHRRVGAGGRDQHRSLAGHHRRVGTERDRGTGGGLRIADAHQ